MKIKAVVQNDTASVKVLVNHPMETGRAKDQNGAVIAAHYITEMTATFKGETVFHAELGPGVSKDPYISFQFSGARVGDTVKIDWIDNKGGSESMESAFAAM